MKIILVNDKKIDLESERRGRSRGIFSTRRRDGRSGRTRSQTRPAPLPPALGSARSGPRERSSPLPLPQRGSRRAAWGGGSGRRPTPARRLGGSLPAALDLGQRGEGKPRLAQLPERLQLGSLRQGRDRGSRGADRELRGLRVPASRLQSPRLPEGRLLHRGDVRAEPAHRSAQAGGGAGLGPLGADRLGPGDLRDRREAGRDRRDRRGRRHRPRPGTALRRGTHHGGARPLLRHDGSRDLRRLGGDRLRFSGWWGCFAAT